MKIAFCFLFFLIQLQLLHAQRAIDTLETESGPIIIFSNKTWSYYNKNAFNGILNKRVHTIMTEEQNGNFTQKWNNDACFSSRNDLSKLKDTVWLCVTDENHPDFVMPVRGVVTSRYGFRSEIGRAHV